MEGTPCLELQEEGPAASCPPLQCFSRDARTAPDLSVGVGFGSVAAGEVLDLRCAVRRARGSVVRAGDAAVMGLRQPPVFLGSLHGSGVRTVPSSLQCQ